MTIWHGFDAADVAAHHDELAAEVDRDTDNRCEEHGHAAVAGIMVIHPEDFDTIAPMRLATGDSIECERCGQEYDGTAWREPVGGWLE